MIMRITTGEITGSMKDDIGTTDVGLYNGFEVSTFRELVEKTAHLSYANKDALLFFRGQSNDYKNKSNKSTFYPTIYRDEYLTKREIEHKFDILHEASAKLMDSLKGRTKQGLEELKRKKYIQWSILQHYEVCGTPFIDFTQSLRVACSFALLNNAEEFAYIYVFAMPYITNRISMNSEHDLIFVRLLSICPPDALRPYFQEGFLAATSDIEADYDQKSELDFNRRLIFKFRIPNKKEFWGASFNNIPEDALYPDNDAFKSICEDIQMDVRRELKPGDIGLFLSKWSDIETKVINSANIEGHQGSFFNALRNLKDLNNWDSSLLNNIDKLRKYRNKLVHEPRDVSSKEIDLYMDLLHSVKTQIQKIR